MNRKVHLYFSTIGERYSQSTWDSLVGKFPDDLRQRIEAYSFWQDRQRSLIGKILLEKMLKDFFNIPNALNKLQLTPHGRPYIEGPVDFNISHSGNYIVCAASEYCKLGIDVEKIRNVDLSTLRHFLTDREWNKIDSSKTPQLEFFRLWSQKESICKANGEEFSLEQNNPEIQCQEITINDQTWFLKEVFIDENHAMFLAANICNYELEQTEIKLSTSNDLLFYFGKENWIEECKKTI